VIAYIHKTSLEAGSDDNLFLISLVIAVIHLIIFGLKLSQVKPSAEV
jgi:hypothetical protein